MDNPPGGADDPAAFSAMARHLRGLGLSAPAILAEDLRQGFLLLEDLGDDLFARLIAADPGREGQLYTAAVDTLLHLQSAPPPPGLPNLAAAEWAEAASFALDWYAFAATGTKPDPAEFLVLLTRALQAHADGPRVLILRDFHAENLIWLPGRAGLARTGLLDFQLGQLGQPGYDLVSLLQDARRDVSPATETAMISRFVVATRSDPQTFAAHYASLGAQRALRILGIFARLCLVAGKPGYLPLIPRVWGQLQRNLAHPALADLRAVCDRLLPDPTPELLQKIKNQCPPTPSR
jgi:aminoglycoside/choline kinase family phosphotransferase